MKLRDHAKGKWPEIVAAVLGEEYTNTRKHMACPKGEGTDRYRFSDVDGTGRFFCGCSAGEKDGFELIQCCKGVDFAGAAKLVESVIGECDGERKADPPHWIFGIAAGAKPVPRSRYMESRGLTPPPTLLWHRQVPYWHDGKHLWDYPAMIAPVKRGDRTLAYHTTYLDAGSKAGVPVPRKVLGGKGLKGCAVHLYPCGPVLGVAEGIETAIAAHTLTDLPVWACLSTSLLEAFEIPASVKQLVIFGDNDKNLAGHAAAYTLAHRAILKGIRVDIRFPDQIGDWNDVLISQRGAA